MALRKSWPSIVFLYEDQGYRPSKPTRRTGVNVGLWWHTEERLVAFVQPIKVITTSGNLIDTDLSHDGAWDVARQVLSCPSKTEYFDIPRGRIIWDARLLCGIIYHGNATPGTVFSRLARLFRLPRWEARLDVHYLTGDALEAFYSLE